MASSANPGMQVLNLPPPRSVAAEAYCEGDKNSVVLPLIVGSGDFPEKHILAPKEHSISGISSSTVTPSSSSSLISQPCPPVERRQRRGRTASFGDVIMIEAPASPCPMSPPPRSPPTSTPSSPSTVSGRAKLGCVIPAEARESGDSDEASQDLHRWFNSTETRRSRRSATANVGANSNGQLPTPTSSRLWTRRFGSQQRLAEDLEGSLSTTVLCKIGSEAPSSRSFLGWCAAWCCCGRHSEATGEYVR